MKRPSPARLAAARVLERVEAEGAFAPIAASSEFRSLGLSQRDRKLATEIINGVLRWRGRLDFYLAHFSKRKLESLSPWIRNALRIAAYQVLFLSSVPHPVALSESVEIAKAKERYAAGFVNGVLRSFLAGRGSVRFPDPGRDVAGWLSTWESHPRWLVERWIAAWGVDGAAALCAANNRPAEVTLRVNIARTTVQKVKDALSASGIENLPGSFCPSAIRIEGAGDVARLPGFEEGHFYVQDEGSQLVAWAVDPGGRERIADLCAGPGGKTTHLAELWRSRAQRADEPGEPPITAFEIHPHRASLIEQSARRLGHERYIRVFARDAKEADPQAHGLFSRVLVDAPCTGTGVLRRRPDLRWQKQPSDIAPLVAEQRELLACAAKLVAPGGTLVYATCSLEPEENVENAKWFLSEFSNFEPTSLLPALPEPARSRLAGSRFGPEGSWIQLAPHLDGTDGMFIFRTMRRV